MIMLKKFFLLFFTFLGVTFSSPILSAVKPIKNILIVVAQKDEAKDIIIRLNLKPSEAPDTNLPITAYEGKYENINVYLILNGRDPVYKVENIGSQSATLTTYVGIKKFHPDFIMSIGTAGGIPDKNLAIGDILVSNKIYFYDRRLHSPDYKLYGNGKYISPNTKKMVKKLNLKIGVICTGDSFDDDLTDLNMLKQENCSAKEMEAAGVAWVSMLEKIPMIAVKGITDYIGHYENHNQYEKNFMIVNKNISIKTSEILKYLNDHTLEITVPTAP